MNKFDNFIDYLKGEKRNYFSVDFAFIEEMIGEKLCPSAYKYTAYWHHDGVHQFAKLIAEAGFLVKPDLKNQRIHLERIR